ncbi:MAG: hypothetical protein QOJ81_223 [Chloroflexota bacterium]|jgi:hypothetical protein|nr:hypothetical protein [Chloroflexota bacterium]
MSVEAALVKEQGVTFVVVPVKAHIFDSPRAWERLLPDCHRWWPGANVVFMARREGQRIEYRGRPDIVRFLSKIPASALPWRRWSVH